MKRIALLILIGVLITIPAAVKLDMDHQRRARRDPDGRLYAEVRGHGDPMVFLASSTQFWGTRFNPLASSHRLIFIDPLGFGRSPLASHYTLDDHLDALHRTLVGLGATRNVTFVAHSFGAELAGQYAVRYPDDVKRLMLIGTPLFANEQEARARIRELPPQKPLRSLRLGTWLLEREARQGEADILAKHPLAPALRRVGRRIIFVHGVRDRVTPLVEVQTLARKAGEKMLVTSGDHQSYVAEDSDAMLQILMRAR